MAKQKGIDVSFWQESIDFQKVKNDGIEFVILREGYRKAIDQRFIEYTLQCKNVGLPVVGVYHFLYTLTKEDAVDEAKSCIANVVKSGLGKDIIIFADFEYDTVTKAKDKGVTLGKADCIEHTKAFCEYVESQGYRAGIYTNIDYYLNMYSKSLIDKYVFWLADYSGDADYGCVFHQYSSGGKVNGINGNVDMDYYFGKEEIKNVDSSSKNNTTTSSTTSSSTSSYVTTDFSKYYGMISNSGSDENGGSHGGKAGDQGNEWCIRSWYNRPWDCVIRHPDVKVRELIAELGIEAANNNKIGYDQYQRDTYWNQLQKVGYRPSKITVACESDCSAGVIANTKAVGYLLGLTELQKLTATYTGNMRNSYRNAGFDILTDSKYINSYDYLVPGDILLNDVHHTATNLGMGSKTGYSANSTPISSSTKPSSTSNKKTLDEVAKEVINGLWGNGDDRKEKLENDGYNYSDVQNKVNELLGVQPSNQDQSSDDGVLKEVSTNYYAKHFSNTTAGTYKTTAVLNMRENAGTNYNIICEMPKNSKVECFGYYNLSSGGYKWYLIQYIDSNGIKYTGYSSSQYLKRA